MSFFTSIASWFQSLIYSILSTFAGWGQSLAGGFSSFVDFFNPAA